MQRFITLLVLLRVFVQISAQDDSDLPEGEIVFVSNRDGNSEIYIMSADGSNLRNLTNHPAEDTSPVWSPDGEKIAFVSDRNGRTSIFIFDYITNEITQLTSDANFNYYPHWFSDGKRIGYFSTRDLDNEFGFEHDAVYILNVENQTEEMITTFNCSTIPAWSPNDQYFAYFEDCNYTLYPEYQDQLVVIDLFNKSSNIFNYYATQLLWSPDSSALLIGDCGYHVTYLSDLGFETQSDENLGLNFPNEFTVSENNLLCRDFGAWSNDGLEFAFTVSFRLEGDEDNQAGLYIADVFSEDVARKLIGGQYIYGVAWSPNDRYIAYLMSDSSTLFIAEVATGEIISQVDATDNDFFPQWRPQPTEND